MNSEDIIIIKLNDGREVDYKVLFSFTSSETRKSYLVYTDDIKDAIGRVSVYANVYDDSLGDKELLPIETEEEWNVIESICSKLEGFYEN